MYPYSRLKALVLVPLVLGLAVTFFQIIILGYQGKFWSQEVIFLIKDGHCKTLEGIGLHCFGDFGFPFNGVKDPSLYSEKNSVLTVNPPMIFVFKLLGVLPYKQAMFLYLCCSVLAICSPFFIRYSKLTVSDKIIWSIVTGLLSIGSLAAIDRANNVIFTVPILLGYIFAVHKSRWNLALFMVVLIAAIKLWAIFLIVALVAKGRYRHAGLAVFLSGLVNFLPIMVLHLLGHQYGLLAKLRFTVGAMFNVDLANYISTYSVSFSALSKRIFCTFNSNTACNMPEVSKAVVGSSIVKILIIIVCLVIVYGLLKIKNVPQYVWMTAISGLPVVAVPDAAIYNSSTVVAGLAAILAFQVVDQREVNQKLSKIWEILTSLPIVASLISFSAVSNSNRSTSALVNGSIYWRSYWYAIPTAWAVFYVGAILLALYQSPCKESLRRMVFSRNV